MVSLDSEETVVTGERDLKEVEFMSELNSRSLKEREVGEGVSGFGERFTC